jgi:hypothetical protein
VDFALFFGGFVVLVLIFLAIGKYYPGSGADVIDWKPTRSYEDEIRLEMEDIDQMIEAQNERRRKTGRPEITEDQVRAEVDAAEEDQRKRSEAWQAKQGPGVPPESPTE